MATTTTIKKPTSTPIQTKKQADKDGSGVKKLNKCGDWMLSMEGKKGYVTIVDMNAVLRK